MITSQTGISLIAHFEKYHDGDLSKQVRNNGELIKNIINKIEMDSTDIKNNIEN